MRNEEGKTLMGVNGLRKKLQMLIAVFICTVILFCLGDRVCAAGELPEWTLVKNGGADYLNTAFVSPGDNPVTAVCGDFLYAAWIEGSGADSALYINKYDGSSWLPAGNTASSSRLDEAAGFVAGPAIAELNGNIYMAWSEKRSDSSDTRIRVKKYDGSSWQYVETYNAAFQDGFKDGESLNWRESMPARDVKLMADNGVLYAAWTEAMGDGYYRVRAAQYNEAANEWSTIDGEQAGGLNYDTGKDSRNPSLAMHNGKLYTAWEEVSNRIRVKRHDGNGNWTFIDGGEESGVCYNPGSYLRVAPVLAEYGGYLFLAWLEDTHYSDLWAQNVTQIRLMKYSDTSGAWEIIDQSSTGGFNYNLDGAPDNPAMLVYNNKMFLSWREYMTLDYDNYFSQIRVMSYDGTNKVFIDGNLSTGINKEVMQDGRNPVMAVFKNELYILWKESSRYENYTPDDWQIRAKKLPFPFAALTSGQPLTEANLNGSSIDVTLSWLSFSDGTLDKNHFTLNNAPPGLTIGNVQYLSPTTCRINLVFDGADFDSDTRLGLTIAPVELSLDTPLTSVNIPLTSNNALDITANKDEESLTITDNGDIWENQEDGKTITVTLNGGTFAPVINAENWTVSNLPEGVSKGSVVRINDNTVKITLSGNSQTDYTSDITNVTVTCTVDEYRDSTGGGPLSAVSGVTLRATYNVVYFGNGNTEGSVPTDGNSYKPGEDLVIKRNTGSLARQGYIFVGWNTRNDETGQSYAEGQTINMPANNLELYAVWHQLIWHGDGSRDAPFQVQSAAHLDQIRIKGMSAHYIQTTDIDLTDVDWEPFGTWANPFTGHYDGGGHTVSNLRINRPEKYEVGLFGFLSGGGTLKDLHVTGANVTGSVNVGILVGNIGDGQSTSTGKGTVENCSVTSSAVNGQARVGGLIGGMGHDDALVKKSYSTATVSANPGGSYSGSAGGFVGFVYKGLVEDCYSAGSVTAGNFTGGFAGEIENGAVKRCYADTGVAGNQPRGFLSNKKTGGNGNVSNSFYNSGTGLSDTYATAKTTAELKQQASFCGWDFETVWKNGEGVSSPTLRWQAWSPDERITAARIALAWADIKGANSAENNVTEILTLPASGAQGTIITWSADPTGYINTGDGTVTRPTDTDIDVTLIATVSYPGGTPRTKEFGLTIIKTSSITIESITPVDNVSVAYGTDEAAAIAALADTTTITDSEDNNHTVNLSWAITGYSGTTPGDYTAAGTFTLPEGVNQTDPETALEVTATVTVQAEHINPGINPAAVSFDLAAPSDISVFITWGSTATSVTEVVYGSDELVWDIHFTIDTNEDTLIIKQDYLESLNLTEGATVEFDIAFNDSSVLTLTVDAVNNHIPSGNADLSGLTLSTGTLAPEFDPDETSYTVDVGSSISSVDVTPVLADSHATVTVNGTLVTSGNATPVALSTGNNTVSIVVTSENGNEKTYTVTINRASLPAETYPVTYHANGGSGTAPTESNKAADATFTAAAANSFTAPASMRFKEWNTQPDGDGATYAAGATITMPASALDLYAVWEAAPVANSYLKVTTLAGGVVRLNSEQEPLVNTYSVQQTMDMDIRLEATPHAGYTFAYWASADTDSVISANPVYQCILGAGVNVKAAFSKIPAEGDTSFTVTFKDKSGRILQSSGVPKGTAATPPAQPAIVGYGFKEWNPAFNNVTSDMIITAIYERLPDTYTVTVDGGTLSTGGAQGQYQFDMPVTVAAGAAPAGQQFSHWTLDNKKVSTKSTFSFFAPMRNTTLKAVFVDEGIPLNNVPFVTLSESDHVMDDTVNRTMMFTIIKNVPAGYTLVECGAMLVKSNVPLTGELTVDTPDALRLKLNNFANDQFYVRKINITPGDTWHARAYLIYKDSNGNMVTVYSDNTVNRTMEGE